MINTIEDFLRVVRPNGPWVLSAISADKGNIDSRTFDDAVAAAAWAQLQNKQRNGLYVHVNKMRADAPRDTKAAKVHVECVEYFHADLDARPLPPIENESTEDRCKRAQQHVEAERARCLDVLKRYRVRPTIVINSGCGAHGWWKLRPGAETALDGTEACADVFALFNKKLAQDLEGDNVHDVSRLLRLPFLTNFASAKKRAKGRVDAPTAVVEYNPDAVYNLSEFEPAALPRTLSPSRALAAPKGVQPPVNVGTDFSVEGIRAWFAANGKAMDEQAESALAFVATGTHPIEPNRYRGDRSRAVFAAACMLVRAGAPNELIAGALLDPNNEISAHVRDQKGNQAAYALRQAVEARKEVDEARQTQPAWDRVDKDGNPIPSRHNTKTALRMLQVECRQDEFRRVTLVEHLQLQQYAGALSDDLEIALEELIHKEFGFYPTDGVTNKAIRALALENRFDSLVDQLNALPSWDGTARLDSWLSTFCGADDNAFTREAGALWLTAAVVRAFEPGAKFDYMLVLQGSQGVGKSTAFRILAGDSFFSDAAFLGAKGAREILEATSGVWIQECAELDGISRRDISAIKADISKQEDSGRPAYARNTVTVKRRFVLGGTTNESRFLQDPSGNRRFWPVTVGRIDLQGLRQARDQIIAEALARYRSNDYRLTLSEAAEAIAREAQGLRLVVDEGYSERLEDLQGCIQQVHGMSVVTNEAVYERLGIPVKDRCGGVPRKVADAMRALGWKPAGAARIDGRVQRHYVWAGEGKPAEPLPF